MAKPRAPFAAPPSLRPACGYAKDWAMSQRDKALKPHADQLELSMKSRQWFQCNSLHCASAECKSGAFWSWFLIKPTPKWVAPSHQKTKKKTRHTRTQGQNWGMQLGRFKKEIESFPERCDHRIVVKRSGGHVAWQPFKVQPVGMDRLLSHSHPFPILFFCRGGGRGIL